MRNLKLEQDICSITNMQKIRMNDKVLPFYIGLFYLKEANSHGYSFLVIISLSRHIKGTG